MSRRCLPLLFILVSTFSAAKANIILITVSSASKPVAAFARDSMEFDRAYAQTPEIIASTATILTGTYPQTHHAGELGNPLATVLPFLPDILSHRGYRSAAFVSTIQLDPQNGPAPGFSRGFTTYDAGFHQATRGENRFASVERRAAEVATRATAWLSANSKSPFFLWVQLNDPETSGAAIAKLIATLKTQKLYDDSLIVITADHGHSDGAHGEETSGIFLYDETIHLPLQVKFPQDQNAGKHVPSRVGLIDIAPTILEVIALPVPSQMQGQSLLRSAKTDTDRPVYSRSDLPQLAFGWSSLESWRAGKYLYIRAPKAELYDLTLDPGAKKNLAQTSKATLDTMAAQLEAFDSHFNDQKGKPSELTSTEMQKLASLGYVGLQKSPAGAGAAVSGTDPKDVIDVANKVLAAMALVNDGKPERALAMLPSPLPNVYLAHYTMSAALIQQQQFAAAIEHLHKAIELQSDSGWAHYLMGLSLLKTADYKTAAVHLEIATTRLPDFPDAHALLAQAYDHLGRAGDARRERSQATAK